MTLTDETLGRELAAKVITFLETGAPPEGVFTRDAFCDFTMPQWRLQFNHLSSSGSPDAGEHALSVIQSADGGFAVAGNWTNSTQPGQCCSGALLLKLQADGSIQWQNAYSGGVY